MLQVYTFEFTEVEACSRLEFFRANVRDFVERWKIGLESTTDRNYYHWLSVEALRSIYHRGSVWKYASDVTESYVHIIKSHFAKYTNKGGAGRFWTKQVMTRILMETEIACMDKSKKDLITPNDWRRVYRNV